MKKSFFILLILSNTIFVLFSQVNYLPINNYLQRDYDYTAFKIKNFHTAVKPYNLRQIDYEKDTFIIKQQNTIRKSCKNNPDIRNFSILAITNNRINYDINKKKFPYFFDTGLGINLELEKISFHSDLYFSFINPLSFQQSLIDSTGIISQQGKFFKEKNGKYRVFTPLGYFIYSPAKYINFEIGNGKTFFGDGYRSLLLSDNSPANPYFKTTVDVWRIKYVYQIAHQKNYDYKFPNHAFSNKYTVSHFLSMNITKWLNINMFETIIASPIDSLGAKRGFDVNYINPVVFFRPVEFSQGSPDNALLGLGGSIKLFRNTLIYGQAILDEFIFSHFKAQDGWWGNKYGLQAGIKSYKTLFIKNLYSQFEINIVRPFTYSHKNPVRAYGNYSQALAHPLGANFKEGIGIISYSFNKIIAQTKFVYSIYGENADTINYGHNINRSYDDRILGDEGYELGDGINTKFLYVEFKISYAIMKNYLYAELGMAYRKLNSSLINQENTIIFIGLRTPMNNRYYDY